MANLPVEFPGRRRPQIPPPPAIDPRLAAAEAVCNSALRLVQSGVGWTTCEAVLLQAQADDEDTGAREALEILRRNPSHADATLACMEALAATLQAWTPHAYRVPAA